MSKTTAPYGTWDSPIIPKTIVSTNNLVFSDVLVDSVTKDIYYLQADPKTGRTLVMKPNTDKPILPDKYSARSRVNDYGGAPAIVRNNTIYFSYTAVNPSPPDNRIYSYKIGDSDAKPLTPKDHLLRYADFVLHPQQSNLLVTLREDHTNDPDGLSPGEVVYTICVVDTTAEEANVTVIISGMGFYAAPVFNKSGNKIAWQEWNLPYMPWQAGVVKYATASIDSGKLTVSDDAVTVAGDVNGTASAAFPLWITGSDTALVYISDCGQIRFQNPYIYDTETQKSTLALEAELDQDFCEPEWSLGLYPYAILGDGKYGAFTAFKDGRNILYIINLTAPFNRTLIPWAPFDFTVAQRVRAVLDNSFVFTSRQSAAPGGIVTGTVSNNSGYAVEFKVLQYSGDPNSPLLEYAPKPVPMTFSTPGPDSRTIYAVRYDPKNPKYTGPAGKYPPCIVGVHGGPTALEPQALSFVKMLFTSRGFAWVDVNYRGSSGYGREYADLLYGHWGRFDVQDCYEVAKELGTAHDDQEPYIDLNHVAIRGGSAGAYVTLSTITFAPLEIRTFYKSACGTAGCIADVVQLTKSSEKFELGYAKELLGGSESDWWMYNPITIPENIVVPLLALQGEADGVVPAGELRDFLGRSAKFAPSGEFVFYRGEGHGFVQGRNIMNALLRELNLYQYNLVEQEE